MRHNRIIRSKRKRSHGDDAMDLEAKVSAAGGDQCYGLESSDDEDEVPGAGQARETNHSASGGSNFRRNNGFRSFGSKSGSHGAASKANSENPYTRRRVHPSSGSTTGSFVSGSFARRSSVKLPRAAVHIVCAIGENLARETCVASLNAGAPVALEVTKQANGQTYAQTIAYLQMLNPHEVLLNEGRKNSQLAQKVIQLFGGDQSVEVGTWGLNRDVVVPSRANVEGNQSEVESTSGSCKSSTVVKFISRACFDQTKGANMLRRVARDETFDASLVNDYIVASSAHAVLNYAQQCLGVTIARRCMEVNLNSGSNNRMAIDRSTLLQLEVMVNAKSGKPRNSLMATMDRTSTTVGRRLLRTSLMAPPCRLDTINARLNLVDTLLSEEEFFYTVLEHLKSLPDLEKVLTNVAVIPKASGTNVGSGKDKSGHPVRMASKGISALVCIKTTLTVIQAFATALEDQMDSLESDSRGIGNDTASQSGTSTPLTVNASLLIGLGNGPPSSVPMERHHLLQSIIRAMRHPALAEVLQSVSDIFTESTTFSRSQHAMRHQECFALKSSEDGMVEVLRKAFLANVDDIYKKADEYAETYGFYVTVRYSTNRGYYLSLPADAASTLPPIFMQPAKSASVINCTTEEVTSLNTRALDNVSDLLLMTNDQIKEVLAFARSKYDALASMSDAVSLLDLCHSFASIVSESRLPWCRPMITEQSSSHGDESGSGSLTILKGRYSIELGDSWQSAGGPEAYVPNDTYASQNSPFTVISGVNGSGKSTYLKQVALIVLLAHCGSYVPAEQASIPIRTRLSVRIGTADDQECNISSFMLEMKETAFVCSNAGPKSLILLDELGRATSNEDGVAIAWSVSEYLLSKHAMTFFVTHYGQLCQLNSVYPGVQNQHLEASIPGDENGEISYTHKVTNGPCNIAADYGVHMGLSCGWPIDVLENARTIESDIRSQLPDGGICDPPLQDADETQALERLSKISQKLARLVVDETSTASLRKQLQQMRQSEVVAPPESDSLQVRMGELMGRDEPDDSSYISSNANCNQHPPLVAEPSVMTLDRDSQMASVEDNAHGSSGGDDNASLSSGTSSLDPNIASDK